MATIVPLTLNNSASPPFSYVFTLDGASYLGSVLWSITAQRYFIQFADQSNNVAWFGPLIGSPLNYDIPLAPGVFASSVILYREDTGQFEVTP